MTGVKDAFRDAFFWLWVQAQVKALVKAVLKCLLNCTPGSAVAAQRVRVRPGLLQPARVPREARRALGRREEGDLLQLGKQGGMLLQG